MTQPKNQYPKLVRDKIPQIIEKEGRAVEYHREENSATYLMYLFAKLVEEGAELSEARTADHQKQELADVREVIAEIQATLNFDEAEIVEIQAGKREERGGFSGRLILDSFPE